MSIETEIVIDLTYLKDVASGNSEFMIEMIDLFLIQTPGFVKNLDAAVKEKNWAKMTEIAHKIKPTLIFMGVESVKNRLQVMETKSRNQEDYEGIVTEFEDMKQVFQTIYAKLNDKKQELLTEG